MNKQEEMTKRLLEIKPDYNVGLNYLGEGREIYNIEYKDGKAELTIEESYIRSDYSMSTRWLVRYPKLTEEQVRYIKGE